MLIHFGTDLLRAEWESADVCVGTFDGVHLGHQEVVRTAVARARGTDRLCVLVTFDRHPAAVLAPDRVPPAVASLAQNLEAFRRLGVAVCIVLHFDERLANVSAGSFLDDILVARLKATELVVGHDFAMGKGREGTAEWLAKRVSTTVVPPFLLDGERVSSSKVRSLVAEGRVAEANRLLGRAFAVQGAVVAGKRLGRELGFPTVNVARSSTQVSPSDGIYAGTCATGLGKFRAAISLGTRPAVQGTHRTLEAHLLDYPGDSLYGTAVELAFHERLRDERDFPDLDALRRQIALDVKAVASLPIYASAT